MQYYLSKYDRTFWILTWKVQVRRYDLPCKHSHRAICHV